MVRTLITTLLFFFFTAASLFGQALPLGPIINELLPNPSGDLESEWVELHNIGVAAFDLQQFKIGDLYRFYNVSDTVLEIEPDEYILLVQDKEKFLSYYDLPGVIVIEPTGWPILNNDGDKLFLWAQSLNLLDTVRYVEVYSNNRSIERYISEDKKSVWGGSFAESGSTPGAQNTFFAPRSPEFKITISPNPFSPDGDGFEDVTTIEYSPPETASFDLALYDLSGRKRKEFFNNGTAIPGELTWDGRDDNGRTLPLGIYILFGRTEGPRSAQIKKTIVLAR
jgi:hypothetical protein